MEDAILITVPHSYCNTRSEGHYCDHRAFQGAEILYRLLKSKYPHINIILIENTELPRYYVDMNRPESRNTNFRRTIAEYIRTKNILWILDMHSFDVSPMGRYIKMYFLDNINKSLGEKAVFERIVNMDPFHITIEGGRPDNDIIYVARENNIRGMLIEISENRQYLSDETLNMYMRWIADIIPI